MPHVTIILSSYNPNCKTAWWIIY